MTIKEAIEKNIKIKINFDHRNYGQVGARQFETPQFIANNYGFIKKYKTQRFLNHDINTAILAINVYNGGHIFKYIEDGKGV